MSAPVVQYAVAWGSNATEIATAVNNYINAGWRPHGSLVCFDSGGGYLHLFQALVKEGKQ